MDRPILQLLPRVLLAVCSIPLIAAEPVLLDVGVEQNGVPLAIEDGRAMIERAPFDLIVTAPEGDVVLVRVSSSGKLLDRARAGRELGDTFKPSQTLPEVPMNSNEELFVNAPETQHAWWYEGVSDHRCSKAVEIEGGYRCIRRVSKLVFQDPLDRPLVPLRTQKAIDDYMARRPRPWSSPIEFANLDRLNFVFLTGVSKGDSTKEKERAFLELEFSEPASKAFDIRVEQNGNAMPIEDHGVALLREPFDIVVTLHEGEGIYVHASLDPPLFNLAPKGRWLGKTFRRLSTYALSLGNESATLRLSPDDAHHAAWIRYDETRHSFSSLEESDGVLRGRVRISNVALGDTSIPISDLGPSAVYLVLFAGHLSTADDGGVELQREWIQIRFTSASSGDGGS